MRRFIASTAAFLLTTVSILAALPGAALADISSGDWTYTVSGSSAIVTGYTGAGGGVVVPDTCDGIPVTEIGPSAFEGNSSIIFVTLPEGVTAIGAGAFRDCTSLMTVCLPGNIAAIEEDTFRGCIGLNYVEMPGNVREIGEYAFGGCVSYRAATLPRWVNTIAPHAYDGCVMLHRGFFYGAPPAMDATSFQGVTADFTCYYHISQTGWGDFTAYPCGPFCCMTVDPLNGFPAKEGVSPIVGGLLQTIPMDPVWAGHTFIGWYKEAACMNAWDFTADIIDDDITLYAKWTPATYAVSFDSQGGSAVASVSAAFGSIVEPSADPVREGYLFGGWYKEAACTSEWNFYVDTVQGDTTLYARWLGPGVPASVTAKSASYNSISVLWNAALNATGYEVLRSASAGGMYVLVGTVSGTHFTDTGLTTNRLYYYMVRSYKQLDSDRVYSDYSSAASARPLLSKPKLSAVMDGARVRLSWTVVPGASMYELWRATKNPDGPYVKIFTSVKTSFFDSKVTVGIDYYYKVVAYRALADGNVYSDYSNVVHMVP